MSGIIARLGTALADRYRVTRELGAGGMATVYLAHDRKHEREVAIKVLHPDLGAALGGERFLAEIKTTAKLQHPHILPLLDSGDAEGLLYYVMPYVRGETLRTRLERERQLSIGDAVRIAREVAGALEHAHRQGIVHRDIKPENILLQDGAAVVADFGIALAVQTAGGARMTQTGLSLGTPQYMSPEQAMGERTVDARSDIYALGAVTYEMLTGEPPFSGASVQAIVAKVLTERPIAPSTVRDTVPPQVEGAVMQALAKLPADRFDSAAAFVTALATHAGDKMGAPVVAAAPWRSRYTYVAVMLALALGLAGGWALFASPRDVPVAGLSILTQLVPMAGESWRAGGNDVAISPDGSRAAIVARTKDWNGILVRPLDSIGSRYLANTAGARSPFWSPDGSHIGFFADRQLKVVQLSSGAVRILCPSSLSNNRAGWGANDVILFIPEFDGTVFRTSGRGGACTPLGLRMPGDSVISSQVQFLNDGQHYLVTNSDFLRMGKIGDSSLTFLRQTQLRRTVPASGGYVLLTVPGAHVGTVFAQQLDPDKRQLVGEPIPLLSDVPNPGGRSPISVSNNGTMLVRVSAALLGYKDTGLRFARFSPDGRVTDTIGGGDTFGQFRIRNSGDIVQGGFHVARWEPASRGWTDIVRRGTSPRTVLNPVWSPNDSMLAVARAGSTGDSIVLVDVRTGSERAVAGLRDRSRRVELTDWTADGRFILFESSGGNANPPSEAWVAELSTGTTRRLFDEPADVFSMRVSPNGRWVAYEALASGVTDVFVRPFPGPGAPIRITSGGGTSPRWRNDGELLVVSGRRVDAVGIGSRGEAGTRRTIITENAVDALKTAGEIELDVSPNGRELLLALSGERDAPLLVISNWQQRLKR